MKHWIRGMRDAFFDALFHSARKDRNVILITTDLGAICLDNYRKDLPGQYINAGVAEQNMIGVAAGLALTGKKVFCYGMATFATMRCYEQIRLDICAMNLPVNIVGVGSGFDFSRLGMTHHGNEDIALMRVLPNMSVYCPADSVSASALASQVQRLPGPKYIRLDREGIPLVYKARMPEFSEGMTEVRKGREVLFVACGRMVPRALRVAKRMMNKGINAGVLDVNRIKPFNGVYFNSAVKDYGLLVTLEEHSRVGGLGSCILEHLSSSRVQKNVLSLGIGDKFYKIYGAREDLLAASGLDDDSIEKAVLRRFCR